MTGILKCMPEMITGQALDDKLFVLAKYDASVCEKSMAERLIALQDIYRVFIPNKMSREIYSKIYLALLRSIQKKQSIFAVRQFHENGKAIRQQSFESIIGGSDSFTIIGPSGIGKSSAVSRAVNILTETPILKLDSTHVVACLQVQAPADSSVKGLLLEILRKADEVLQTNYHANAIRGHSTIDMLIGSVSQVALNHIGLLIVDEIQNVVNSKNGKTVIGTLTQLINNSGVSICMVGTPESAMFFEQAMILARRSLGLTYSMMGYGDEFREFCRTLLRFCYVKEPLCIDEAMLMWLYNHFSGNASVVVGLIHDAQEIAIMEGIERLDISMLNAAYESRMNMLHDFLSPEPTKAPRPRKSKNTLPDVQKDKNKADTISIHQISMAAKEFQNDVVSELKRNGIQVEEVAV